MQKCTYPATNYTCPWLPQCFIKNESILILYYIHRWGSKSVLQHFNKRLLLQLVHWDDKILIIIIAMMHDLAVCT